MFFPNAACMYAQSMSQGSSRQALYPLETMLTFSIVDSPRLLLQSKLKTFSTTTKKALCCQHVV